MTSLTSSNPVNAVLVVAGHSDWLVMEQDATCPTCGGSGIIGFFSAMSGRMCDCSGWGSLIGCQVEIKSGKEEPTQGAEFGGWRVARYGPDGWAVDRRRSDDTLDTILLPAPDSVVGTVTLERVVPIVGPDGGDIDRDAECIMREGDRLTLWGVPDYWNHEQDEADLTSDPSSSFMLPGLYAWKVGR